MPTLLNYPLKITVLNVLNTIGSFIIIKSMVPVLAFNHQYITVQYILKNLKVQP